MALALSFVPGDKFKVDTDEFELMTIYSNDQAVVRKNSQDDYCILSSRFIDVGGDVLLSIGKKGPDGQFRVLITAPIEKRITRVKKNKDN